MEMSLLAAVGIFLSTFVAPLVNFFLTIGLWLVGTVLNPLYETIADNAQSGAISQGFAKIVTSVLPNFANFDVKNPIINPGQVIENEQVYYMKTIAYGVVYTLVLIIGGILVFDRREV